MEETVLLEAEAEFYALATTSVEAGMAQRLLREAGTSQLHIPSLMDSSAAQRQGAYRMKHIQLRHLFVKKLIWKGAACDRRLQPG